MKTSNFRSSFIFFASILAAALIFLSYYYDPSMNSLNLLGQFTAIVFEIASTQSTDYKYCYNASTMSIIFLQVTGRTNRWNRLEACALRQAARLNQPTGVCVLTAIEMEPHANLIGLPNLEFARLDVEKILNGTSMHDWYRESYLIEPGRFAMHELSDAVRYAYLWKFGGFYLDTDVIALRNFTHLRNSLAREGVGFVNNAVMFFDKSHPFLKQLLDEGPKSYNASQWGTFGPPLIGRILADEKVPNDSYRLLSTEFYPMSFREANLPFSKSSKIWTKNRTRNSYTLHLWRSIFGGTRRDYWNNDRVKISNRSFIWEICGDI